MLGLALFMQLPLALNVCLSGTGGVRTGFGCQCPDCDPPAPAADLAVAAPCPCDSALCAGPGSGEGAESTLQSAACCDDFKLPYQVAAARQPAPKSGPAPAPACIVKPATVYTAVVFAGWKSSLREFGQPPGRTATALLRHTVLLI